MIFNNFNEYMIFVEHTSQNNVFYSVLIAEHKWSLRSPIKMVSIELYSYFITLNIKNILPKLNE